MTATLNATLAELGYVTAPTGNGTRRIMRAGETDAIRFPEGTLPAPYEYVRNLAGATADLVWTWLRATGQRS